MAELQVVEMKHFKKEKIIFLKFKHKMATKSIVHKTNQNGPSCDILIISKASLKIIFILMLVSKDTKTRYSSQNAWNHCSSVACNWPFYRFYHIIIDTKIKETFYTLIKCRTAEFSLLLVCTRLKQMLWQKSQSFQLDLHMHNVFNPRCFSFHIYTD